MIDTLRPTKPNRTLSLPIDHGPIGISLCDSAAQRKPYP
jgi:hypothetical protein